MSQLINLSTLNTNTQPATNSMIINTDSIANSKIYNPISLEENIAMLRERFPSQILFTLKEASAIIKVSYEYVRQKVVKGEIEAISFSKRKQIHLLELAKLISQGI